jgi:hypothetical protein
LSLSGSSRRRTFSVFRFCPHQTPKTIDPTMSSGASHTICFDSTTSSIVGAGRSAPNPANIVSKIGTMKMSIAATDTKHMMMTITG